MRVLLIESDSPMARSIELMLRSEGNQVYTTDLGEEGVDLGKLYDYDVILLATALSDMTGLEVLKTVRAAKVQTPVLILADRERPDMGNHDFRDAGANDVLAKPFEKADLIARVSKIFRESERGAQSVVVTGMLSVNLDAKMAMVDSQRVHLTGREFQILELMSLRKGTTLTKEMFLNHLYGGMDEPDLKVIDVFICKLRKKLAAACNGQHYIETVWGRGYVLRDPDSASVA